MIATLGGRIDSLDENEYFSMQKRIKILKILKIFPGEEEKNVTRGVFDSWEGMQM